MPDSGGAGAGPEGRGLWGEKGGRKEGGGRGRREIRGWETEGGQGGLPMVAPWSGV